MTLAIFLSSSCVRSGRLFLLPLLACVGDVVAQSPEFAYDSTQLSGPAASDDLQVLTTATGETAWLELRLAFDELVSEADWPAAAATGHSLLGLTELQFGQDSAELATLRLDVAAAQVRNGDFALAEANAQAAIAQISASAGPYSEAMIDPYLSLGDAYFAAGDAPRAMSAYGEARIVSRRVHGVINLGQVGIIERMIAVMSSLGSFDAANGLRLEALELAERNHAPSSPETLEAIYEYAYWLRENHRYSAERDQYERASRIINLEYGDDSPLLIRPLRERANSYRTQGAEHARGILGLREALRILQAEPDPLQQAEVLRDLGDWETAFSMAGSGGDDYREAWNLLGQLDDAAGLREAWFGASTIVWAGPLDRSHLTNAPGAPSGNVVLGFTVDAAGLTHDVEVIESHPAGLKDEAFARQLLQSRFRPMLRDGEPVATRRTYNIEFRYRLPEG